MFFHITIAHKIPLTRQRVLQLQYVHVSKTMTCTNIHVILTIRKALYEQCHFLLLFQTDKTMAELEIDINMRIREWDVIQVGIQTGCFFFFFVLPVQSIKYISQSSDVSSCSSKFQMSLMMSPHLH